VIAIAQAAPQFSGVSPWESNWDGTGITFPIAAPNVFTGPQLPFGGNALAMKLRWGAGGTSFETRFDYPVAGASFGVTADMVDLSALPRGVIPTYANPGLVPIVGAFMVPGVAADPSPLRWFDVASGLLSSAGIAVAMWSVKPYARRVRVELLGGPSASVDIIFEDTAGSIISQQRVAAPGTFIVDVPAQATILEVSNNTATNISVRVEWYIGFV
jgi:hypothetical protein